LTDSPPYQDPFDRSSVELSENDKNLLMDVKKYGFNIMLVGEEDPAHDHPPKVPTWPYPWAYSIGLYHTYRHPEMIVVGLPEDLLGSIVSRLGNRVLAGDRFQPGQEYDEIIQTYRCVFLPVAEIAYPKFLNYATLFYRGFAFPALHCVWPDSDGQYPWERHPHPGHPDRQPNLRDEHGNLAEWAAG
jgi:hypothetical protein